MNEYRREYQVDIIVRAHGNWSLTDKCCNSIFDNTPDVSYQLIFIDNGSPAGIPDYFFADENEPIVVELPFNHGSVRAINVGLSLALLSDAPYILLLDNDTEIPDGDRYWLERFIEYFDDPKVGAAGAVTDFCAGPQHIERLPDRAEGQPPHEPPVLVSFAMMLRKTAVDQVLFFDERYEPGNFEDYDYCLQLREAGWKCVIADGVFIHHEGHATFKGMNLNNLLTQNMEKFRAKWTATKLDEMGVQL